MFFGLLQIGFSDFQCSLLLKKLQFVALRFISLRWFSKHCKSIRHWILYNTPNWTKSKVDMKPSIQTSFQQEYIFQPLKLVLLVVPKTSMNKLIN